MTMENICKNCGHRFTGKFCNNCGEKVYTQHDKSMRHFFEESLHFFLHLDNKFFKTLFLIFRQPGRLSIEYCDGARNKYYRPLSLFLIGVILYLLFPIFQGLNTTFETNIEFLEHKGMSAIAKLATYKSMAGHISLTDLGKKYDHLSPAIAKILLLILLPLTAFILNILFSKRRKFFFDYLTLATELNTTLIFGFFLCLPLVLKALSLLLSFFHIGTSSIGDEILVPIYTGFLIFWAANAFTRFFKISYKQALVKTLLFLFLQTILFIIYRVLLFLTVLLFI